jgi:B12-binding domain/radical SAM domain protein
MVNQNINPSIHFRYFKNNMQSIAVLKPLIPGADIVHEPCNDIMLYSFATQQAPEVFLEVGHSKICPIFIAGGPHPSARPEETLGFFDFVVLGEGEETLPELIKILQKKGDVSSVRGIAFKDKKGIVLTEKREHITLDRYPPFGINDVRSAIEITRGCPFSCAYCQTPQIFGHRMRHRSIDEIARYAKFLKDVRFTSPNAFAYGSEGISPRIEKIEALLRSLPRKNIFFGTFPSEVRPEFINDRILELVSDHCANTTLSLGGQSGSQKILDMIHRLLGLKNAFSTALHPWWISSSGSLERQRTTSLKHFNSYNGSREKGEKSIRTISTCSRVRNLKISLLPHYQFR